MSDFTIHNVTALEQTKIVRRTHESSGKAYWVMELRMTSVDAFGNERTDTMTLFSKADDECQVTVFPAEGRVVK